MPYTPAQIRLAHAILSGSAQGDKKWAADVVQEVKGGGAMVRRDVDKTGHAKKHVATKRRT